MKINAAKGVHAARFHIVAHAVGNGGGAAPSRVCRVKLSEFRRAVPGRRRQEVPVLFRTGLGKDPGIVADQYEAVDIKGVEG